MKLIEVCDVIKKSGVFETKSQLDWMSDIQQMHERGWLFSAYHGDRPLAVAGAFRIPNWDPLYLERLPEKEEGDLLFISFFVNLSGRMTDSLRMLRDFLREHKEVNKVVYHRKFRKNFTHICKDDPSNLVSHSASRPSDFPTTKSRFSIQPPMLLNV